MKEYIDIFDKDGNSKKAEVILRFRDEDNNNYYIVYKYNNELFAAKYDDIIGTSRLDTNLSNKELELLEGILSKIGEE